MPAKEPLFNRLRNYGVSNVLKRNLIAEFTATFFLVVSVDPLDRKGGFSVYWNLYCKLLIHVLTSMNLISDILILCNVIFCGQRVLGN